MEYLSADRLSSEYFAALTSVGVRFAKSPKENQIQKNILRRKKN